MQSHATMREKVFNLRLSDEEAARLDAIATHYGLNAAGVIRMLVKREHDAITPPTIVKLQGPKSAEDIERLQQRAREVAKATAVRKNRPGARKGPR